MDIYEMISSMEEHIFDEQLIKDIYAEYDAEVEDGAFHETETEYAAAVKAFSGSPADIQAHISEMEQCYQENRIYALRYSFWSGLYSAFGQLFQTNENGYGNYTELVTERFLTMPYMKRHPQYYKNADRCLELVTLLEGTLDKGMRYHLTSIECAWGERIHYTTITAFYLGYRFALSISKKFFPTSTLDILPKQLVTEWELGLINLYNPSTHSK